MPLFDGKVVLSGVGQSELGRVLPQSGLALTIEACLSAVAHAGLQIDDIDGLCTYPGSYERQPGYTGAGAGDVIDALALKVDWYLGSGEIPGQVGAVVAACMAVASGVCRHVLVFRSLKEGTAQVQLKGGRASVLPLRPKTSHWSEWNLPFGLRVVSQAGIYAARYMGAYEVTREQLAQIALNDRLNAAKNPHAVFRKPLTLDEYLAARIISTPFCLFDCDVPMDGCTAVVVSHIDAAPKLRPYILVESAGSAVYRRMWEEQLEMFETAEYACGDMMWRNTDLRPQDVDIAQVYDGFSFQALAWLDALHLCDRGGAGRFIAGGERIALEGELPINTQGGALSGGRLHGLGAVHEIAVQLWGEAGERQAPNSPRIGAVGTGGEWFAGSLLLNLLN